MIQLLAEHLAAKIRAERLVTVAGGLALPWKSNAKELGTIPAVWDYVKKEHYSMVRDADNAAMSYFEEYGSTQIINDGKGFKYVADLVLVVWLNTEKGVFSPSLIEQLQQLYKQSFNTSIFSNITVTFKELLPENEELFKRYGYNSAVRKYLHKPYDAFGLRMSVKFGVCEPALMGRQFDDSFQIQFR